MGFEKDYARWMERHSASRSGERLRRLREGHGYGEKLFLSRAWYPAIGHFDDLHPEYEVFDYRDGSRYLDHAFVRFPYKINWETDAYGTHWSKISRKQYDDGLERQNQILHEGWKVFRFSVDQLNEQPRKCQQFIQQVMGRLYGGSAQPAMQLSLKEREIPRIAVRLGRPITATDVCERIGVARKHSAVSGQIEVLRTSIGKQRAEIELYGRGCDGGGGGSATGVLRVRQHA